MTNTCRILVGNPKGKRPPRITRRRWVDNIKVDLEEKAWGDMNWINLAQDRCLWRVVVNTAMHLRVL
jgi:hypothetical protein